MGDAGSVWADNVTMPNPIYIETFESASFSGTTFTGSNSESGVQTGTGEIVAGTGVFGKYYQNKPTTLANRANYLKINSTAFQAASIATNKTVTLSFWVNTKYHLDNSFGTGWNAMFEAFTDAGFTAAASGAGNYVVSYGAFNIRTNTSSHALFADYNYHNTWDSSPAFTENTSWITSGWHHIAYVLSDDEGKTHLNFYVDGVLNTNVDLAQSGEGTLWSNLSSITNYVLGGCSGEWSDPDAAFGYDDVAIYDVALTADQVNQIISAKTAITAIPSSFDFSTANALTYQTIVPFDKGVVVAGDNVNALRFGSTQNPATAYFDINTTKDGRQAYEIAANEIVTFTIKALHGYLSGNKTATVSIVNSAGIVLASYTYDSGLNITDVKIGGTTVAGFESFEFASRTTSSNANGLAPRSGGNPNKPYLLDAQYNPVITISIFGDGNVDMRFTRTTTAVSKEYHGTLGGAVAKDLAKIVVNDGITNDDRAYCIQQLSIATETETAPTISILSPATIAKKDATHTLTANVASKRSYTIQWYSNTVNSTEGAVAIPSATDATYSPSTNTLGTTYYYAIATNAIGSTISNIVPVVVSNYQTEFSVVGNLVSKSVAYNTADEELTSTNVTISGGSMYVSNYKSGEDQQVITSGGKFSLNGNAVFFKVVLDEALQAGDIISASVGNKTGYGISIYAEYNTSGIPSTTNHADLATTSNNFETHSYTVKESDTYLIGKKTFYVYRLTANGTYFDNLTISRPNSVSGKIGATGWSSFSTNYKLDLSTISGASAAAYYASSKDGSNVNLASTTAIVNAGEGLMIKGTPGETFTIGKTSSATTFGETNLLFGCPTATEITAEMIGSNDYYVVANNSGTAEFQKLASAITIPTGKAYLQVVKGGAKALNIIFEDETATGVEAPVVVEAAEEDGVYYNLNGQVVTKDYKGIVIKNGKKYLNK